MRRVLVIAHHFPPAGTGGVGRAVAWARHLGAHGWQPTILAAPPQPNWPRDESLLNQIPDDVRVHRAFPPDPRPRRFRGLNHRELSFLWQWPAVKEARKVLASERYDAILATVPPPAAHAAACTLSREFAIPWVADFRDPWAVRAPTGWRRWRRRRLARGAKAVTAVNDRLRAHLETALERPVSTIFNGFEPEEMPAGVTKTPRRVVYMGTLSEVNDLDGFYLALARLEGEFMHIGATQRYNLEARARRAGLSRVVQTGYLQRARALERAASAAVYLVSLKPSFDLSLPTKMFDYIGLGGPVLCVGDAGAAADFVRRHARLGIVCAANDPAAIAKALDKLWSEGSTLSEEDRAPYTRRRMVQVMAALLDRVVAGC